MSSTKNLLAILSDQNRSTLRFLILRNFSNSSKRFLIVLLTDQLFPHTNDAQHIHPPTPSNFDRSSLILLLEPKYLSAGIQESSRPAL